MTAPARILVSGSLAYDRIFDFRGKFADHILPDKIHALNVSFFVPDLKESYGGCAGNIAYSLSLLGQEPVILARGGNDFGEYAAWLGKNGVPTGTIELDASARTSSATIITDEADNQIVAFYPGAGAAPYGGKPPEGDFAIVGPGNPEDMRRFPEAYRANKTPFIFDPGQQITTLSGSDLENGMRGSRALIANDYEMAMMREKTGFDEKGMLGLTEMIVTTLGEKGSRVLTKTASLEIPAAKPGSVADPTGAGDAYRAGFAFGLLNGWPIETAGRLASVVACYTIELAGTQTHAFTLAELAARYRENYHEAITL